MLKQKLKIIKPNKHRAVAVTTAESEEDMYILTTTAKRKNGKRHITLKSNDLYHLRDIAQNNINKDRYVVEIYSCNWSLLERM